jgi:hypothetical protein
MITKSNMPRSIFNSAACVSLTTFYFDERHAVGLFGLGLGENDEGQRDFQMLDFASHLCQIELWF